MDFFQSFCLAMGNKACYLFCIIKIAFLYLGKTDFKPTEVIKWVLQAIENGYVRFNWTYYADDNNFYVLEPTKILEMITGKKWSVVKSYNVDYKPKEGEFIVSWYTINDVTGHFDLPQYDFHNYQFSKTVSQGHVGSLRIFKCIEE